MTISLSPNVTSPSALALWFKECVYGSRALQLPYQSWMDLRSRLALRRSRPYEAASRILHMWRHLGTDGVGSARRACLQHLIREHCYRDSELVPLADNGFLRDYLKSPQARHYRRMFGSFTRSDQIRLRMPNDDNPERQGDLIILKPFDAATGEYGAIMLMYSHAISAAAAIYDLPSLASQYMFVLEPSSWGYQDARFLLYVAKDMNVLVQSPRRADFEFIDELQTNLVPTRVGAGEWVDPATFQPRAAGTKAKYDVVMVAAFDPLKRHEVFFRAAAQLKQSGRPLRVALIGYELGFTRAVIEGLLRKYDLASETDIFESIPHDQVACIVADSAVSILLSRREGANRAIYESMFCNTPVIVYRHQCGVNLDHVNARTGLLADDDELAGAISYLLDHRDEFDPRAWAIENAGYDNATAKLNEALARMAARAGVRWTRGMVAKKSAPHLRYAQAGLYKKFESEYERLSQFLLPVD